MLHAFSLAYDELSRLTTITSPLDSNADVPADTVVAIYDESGHLLSADDSDSTLDYCRAADPCDETVRNECFRKTLTSLHRNPRAPLRRHPPARSRLGSTVVPHNSATPDGRRRAK